MKVRLFRTWPLTAIFTASLVLSSAVQKASAQDIVGRISGTVTDSQGAVVPGANVTITNEATDISRTLTTNEAATMWPTICRLANTR